MQMYWKFGALTFRAESAEEFDFLTGFEKQFRQGFHERDDATGWISSEGVSRFTVSTLNAHTAPPG